MPDFRTWGASRRFQNAASFCTGAAVIKAGDGDTLTLNGITTLAQLEEPLGRLHVSCMMAYVRQATTGRLSAGGTSDRNTRLTFEFVDNRPDSLLG